MLHSEINSARAYPVTRARKRILVIDDNEDMLSLLELSLQGFGFKVLIAASGQRGLAAIAAQQVDLVILDYRMPEMDGEAVAREIRRLNPQIPIIMYSAALEEIPGRVLELVDEFVSKQEPISSLVYHIPRVGLGPSRPRRISPRHPFHVPFLVLDEGLANGLVLHGESIDLSEDGIGGTLDGQLPAGKVVRLQISLAAEAAVAARASVRYRAGARHGFKFLELTRSQLQSIRRSLSS